VENETVKNQETSTSEPPHYDPHIIPAETAARLEREGDRFMKTPSLEHDEEAATDDQTTDDSIETTAGYRVDNEGLIDNFAIEPEMYYEVPGDLKEKEEQEAAARAQELAALQDDEEGKLTMEGDKRPKGQGII
jgi:hypothetical protein